MKKLLIACSMISACALVACADTPSVQGTPKTTPLDWFDVSTTATNHGTLAIADGSDALCEVVDGKFEIDSDIDNLVTFTATDLLTQQMAKVTFNLDAAVVPNGALQTFTESNKPKVAFALYQSESATDGTTTNFTAWVGSDWIQLTGATPKEGDAYTLIMEFDNRTADVNKVRFSTILGNTTNVLTGAGATDNWFSSTNRVSNTVNVNFVGCGKVASVVGKQLEVVGEIIVIGGKGSVDIDNVTEAAFAKIVPQGKTVDVFLASNANESFEDSSIDKNLLVAEAYALGLIVKSGDTMVPIEDGNGALKVKADAQASTTGGIPVNLNIQPPADSGATISYQLQGSTDGSIYTNIGEEKSEQSAIKIPTDYVDGSNGNPKYRYFKVVTKVTLKGGETPAPQE